MPFPVKLPAWGGIGKDILLLALSALSLALSIAGVDIAGIDAAWIAIILCGVPIMVEAVTGLVTRFDIKADVLVSMALAASIVIGEVFAAGEVAFIMQLGALLEELTVAKARAGIERLVSLTPATARRLSGGKEEIIAAEDVLAGDILRILPGESIPVDGIIISGRTSIDQSVMTGEAIPVDKAEGDEVSSGTVNCFGAFDMKAVKVGEDSSIQRMIRLVQSADAGKARIVGIADRWATWVVIIALAAAAVTWLATGEAIRAVTILVVFCPCAMVLATPTAIMAAIGNATKHGFLVREGDALERLSSVSAAAFDKTGTLTYGRPEVIAVRSYGRIAEDELYMLAASAESLSEHPLGKAIAECYRACHDSLPSPEDFRMVPGMGVSASVCGHMVAVGSVRFLAGMDIEVDEAAAQEAGSFISKGCTVIYVAADGRLVGLVVLSDTLRDDAAEMVSELSEASIRPLLITGDRSSTAQAIAARVGIADVRAECLPEDKLGIIGRYQGEGIRICMIGDGINDAPALRMADVGIAMGGIGSDIAISAADITLINDRICEIPHLMRLSRRMMTAIRCNLAFSMALNFAAISLAIAGILDPVAGAMVHNAGSVLVIVNSALLLNWKR